MAFLSVPALATRGLSQTPLLVRNTLLAVAGTAALTLAAKFTVPLYPVPMTMQSLAVLMIGAAYGWRLGAVTVLLYLAEAAAGLPVLAGGGGLAYMAGPTGGYLLGFVLAAALCGYLAERGLMSRLTTALPAMLLGTLAIDAPGLIWLATLTGGHTSVLTLGFIPFIPGDLTKVALAAALAVSGRTLFRSLR